MSKRFITCPKCGKMARFATTVCPHCSFDGSQPIEPTPEVEAAAAELTREEPATPITWPDMPADLLE